MTVDLGNEVSQSRVLVDVMESLDRQIEALTKARDLLRGEPLRARKLPRQNDAKTPTARILRMASRP